MTSLDEADWQCPLNCVPFVKYLSLERRALFSINKGQGLQTLSEGRGVLALQAPEFTPRPRGSGGRRGLSADREDTTTVFYPSSSV